MVTASGEVQTNEEAQVSVHELDLFVTVQILDDTLAVLSLGKLCDEHGFSYEWASGKLPRLTEQGKNILCKTENFVSMVVHFWHEFVIYIAIAGLLKSERSDELAPGNCAPDPKGSQQGLG